ncbi:hypothetical protein [Nocardia sp. NPDC051463]|uniref:WXG100 family type VII secretion target n=1 Tax=Nocardia sp. NPDC051463 TaxID=3154845 RepID=UPI00343D8459
MTSWTNVVPAKVQTAANNSTSCLGELESHLNGLSSAQDELEVAVRGMTGTAIRETLTSAYQSGKSLAATLQEIVDALADSGVQIDAHDVNAAAEYKQFGADGSVSEGDGMIGAQAASKVDIKSWA